MIKKEFDVFSSGNALVDIIIESSEEEIIKTGVEKGGIIFLDEKKLKDMMPSILEKNPSLIPGGSAANVISLLSNLGSKSIFLGKVGKDNLGEAFENELKKEGTITLLSKDNTHTGTAITMITPDKERSFAVCLGASTNLKIHEINIELIKKSKIVHIEGYQLYDTRLKDVAIMIAKTAKDNNSLVSFDLSSHDLVRENIEMVKWFIKEYVDIVFANEKEAHALTKKNPYDAVHEIGTIADISIVKIGQDGSIIKTKNDFFEISPVNVTVVDTNGAGDAYAGAFLHAFLHEKNIEECGNFASFMASCVVAQRGARLSTEILKEVIKSYS